LGLQSNCHQFQLGKENLKRRNKMKHWIVFATLLVIFLLVTACQPPEPTPNIQGTVNAQVSLLTTQTAIAQTQTAIAQAQTTLAAEKTTVTTTKTNTTQASTSSASPKPVVPSSAISKLLPAACPFYVYADWGSGKNHFVPKGWMGDYDDVKLDDNYKLDSSRPNIIQIIYIPKGKNQYAGVYWWDPPEADWGNKDGGFNLTCATKLTFWAKGDKGGEKGEFKVGGLKGTYQDSLQPVLSTGPIVLKKEWMQYTLDLKGKDLSHIIGGFVWVTSKPENPSGATIYLDEIRYE
jgi:hypothetical protein